MIAFAVVDRADKTFGVFPPTMGFATSRPATTDTIHYIIKIGTQSEVIRVHAFSIITAMEDGYAWRDRPERKFI